MNTEQLQNYKLATILNAYNASLDRIAENHSNNMAKDAKSTLAFATAINNATSLEEIDELKRIFTPEFTRNLMQHAESLGQNARIYEI
jgi:hypothetical protein